MLFRLWLRTYRTDTPKGRIIRVRDLRIYYDVGEDFYLSLSTKVTHFASKWRSSTTRGHKRTEVIQRIVRRAPGSCSKHYRVLCATLLDILELRRDIPVGYDRTLGRVQEICWTKGSVLLLRSKKDQGADHRRDPTLDTISSSPEEEQ